MYGISFWGIRVLNFFDRWIRYFSIKLSPQLLKQKKNFMEGFPL